MRLPCFGRHILPYQVVCGTKAFAWICGRGKFSELLIQCKYSVTDLEYGRETGGIGFKKALDPVSHVIQARQENRDKIKL